MTQNVIAGIIVLLCVVYVLRKFIFKRSSASPCDGCGKCSGKSGGCH